MQEYTAVRLCLIQQHTIKAYVEVEVSFHRILTSTLDRGQWSASGSGCCTPDEAAVVAHCKRGYVASRTGLDAVEKNKTFVSHQKSKLYFPVFQSTLVYLL
jgi:hypothetical protein